MQPRVLVRASTILFSVVLFFSSALQAGATVTDNDSSQNITQEQLKVGTDAISGAFTSTFPITLPPGRNGLKPDLSLSYTSSDTNKASVVGYGWTLSIPKIERLPRHGSNHLYSNHDFSSTFSGELKDISLGSGGHGTYGGKVDDGSFLAYTYNTDDTWTVIDKTGKTYTFGGNTNAQVVDPGIGTHIFTWYLTKVQDINGNTVVYTYTKNNNQVYPSSINYTGHSTSSGIFDVTFTTESRSDASASFISGFGVKTIYRVSKITVKESGNKVREYVLGYSAGNNGIRSLLHTITETGTTEDGSSSISKPATTFAYSTAARSWTQDTGFSNFPAAIAGTGSGSMGVYVFDVNGDNLPDVVKSRYGQTRAVYINNGNNTWTQNTGYSVPLDFSGPVGQDMGVRVFDMNGDGYLDLAYARTEISSSNWGVYINNANGTGWTLNTSITIPVAFSANGKDYGTRVFDANGDGMDDIVRYRDGSSSAVYINNSDGTGWTQDSAYSVPVFFATTTSSDNGVRVFDVNADGLQDLVYGRWTGTEYVSAVYINNGDGTGWTQDTNYSVPLVFIDASRKDMGTRAIDLNGDGLPDLVRSRFLSPSTHEYSAYINKGDGTGWAQDTGVTVPMDFVANENDIGVRELDVNGDGLDDILYSRYISPNTYQQLYVADGGPADLLTAVTNDQGGETDATYGAHVEQAGKLFFPMRVVSSVAAHDGMGNTSTISYQYENGSFYYSNEYDRKFAGFGKVTTTDPLGNVTVDFYHQGNSTDSTHGEATDDISKIWHRYREEQYSGTSTLYKTIVDKWTNYSLGTGRNFVYRNQSTELLYDGQSGHVDKAMTFTYDTSSGNLTEEKQWGTVSGSNDGSFTDTGSDIIRTTYAYAAWTSGGTDSSYPSSQTLLNQSGSTVQQAKWKYDGLSAGQVTYGNATEKQQWITGTTYANTDRTFDSYGVVATTTDPRGKTTTFTVDSYELYPATVTDALSHTMQYSYDYSSGKVVQMTDNNGFISQTVLDTLDRPTEEKQPVPSSPTTLETRKTYAYTISSVPNSVHETDKIDGSTSKEIYTYVDGFGRPIQRREESASSYNATDTVYDSRGDVSKTSLPYISSGSSRTSATTTSSLLETTSYDALHRVTSKVNAAGTTTMSYNHDVVTVTDPDGNVKVSNYDPYGRLINVDEHVGSNVYTTGYALDAAGRLTQLTDPSGNVRNFSYDGLGDRTSAEDLHGTSDTAYGAWSYAFDVDGNLSSSTSPVGTTTSYAYDDLDRVLTIDTPASGTDETYSYDSCTNGIGKLCSAVLLNGATTAYTYDPLGRSASEAQTVGGTTYTTSYAYTRQGAVASVTYPDTSSTGYQWDAAGNLHEADFTDVHGSGSTAIASSITYGPHGRMTAVTYGNGVASAWTYDSSDLYRLQGKTTTSGSSHIEDFTYGYDANGNLTSLGDASTLYASMSVSYGYDALNRLTSGSSSSSDSALAYSKTWSYNALGDLTASDAGSYTYGGTASGNYANPHAPTAVGSTTLAYDHDGNLSGDGTWTNTWNYRDRLASSANGTVTVNYSYDHKGNRVSQNNGTLLRITPNDYYVVSGANTERNILVGSLGSVATSTWNGTASSLIYHHTDHLGGTHVETDGTGAAVEYILYTPFGGTLIDHKSGAYEDHFKYTGKEKDADTGWYYYGARYYNATDGVFMSEDPVFLAIGDPSLVQRNFNRPQIILLSDPQALNSFAYARNNPVIYRDPDGRAFGVDDAAGFAVGGVIGSVVYAGESLALQQPFTKGGFAGAFIAGGIMGVGTVNIPETLGASEAIAAAAALGALSAFTGDAVKQKIDTGHGVLSPNFDWKEAGANTLFSGVTAGVFEGLVPDAAIPGLSSGRGNMNAVRQGMLTKSANGTITNISVRTGVLSTIGSQASDFYKSIAGFMTDVGKSQIDKSHSEKK